MGCEGGEAEIERGSKRRPMPMPPQPCREEARPSAARRGRGAVPADVTTVTGGNPARTLTAARLESPIGGITDENPQPPDFNLDRRGLHLRPPAATPIPEHANRRRR